jgi:hypothetical protein
MTTSVIPFFVPNFTNENTVWRPGVRLSCAIEDFGCHFTIDGL